MSVENGPYGFGTAVRLVDGSHLCLGWLENYTPSGGSDLGTYSVLIASAATIDAVTHETAVIGGRTFGGNSVQEVAMVRLQKARHVSDPYPGGWGQRFVLATEDAQVLLDLGEKAAVVNTAAPPVGDVNVSQGNAPDAPPEQTQANTAPLEPPVVEAEPPHHHHKHES